MSQSIEHEIVEDEVEGAEAAAAEEEEIEESSSEEEQLIEPLPVVALDDPAQQKRLVEALLFASPEPIALKAIQSRLPDSADVGFILTSLQEEYAERGVNLVRLEDAWKMYRALFSAVLILWGRQEMKLWQIELFVCTKMAN